MFDKRPPEAQSSPAAPSPTPGVLDAQALATLRSLDPQGESKLIQRVVAAFESSAGKLLPQLRTALAAGDHAGVRHVAHTLKSSSASVGALALSRTCAEIEGMVRENRVVGLDTQVALVLSQVEVALDALRRLGDEGRP